MNNDPKFPMPQYLGSKTKYIEHITSHVPDGVRTVLDAFSGSGIVSFAFKKCGFRVVTNDMLTYNATIGKALIENNFVMLDDCDVSMLFEENKDKDNFIEREFTDLFYTREECYFLDNLHANIMRLTDPYKRALAFSSIGRTLIRKVLFAYFCHTKALEYRKIEKHYKRNPVINADIKTLYRQYIDEYNKAVFNNHQQNRSTCTDILVSATDYEAIDMVYMDPPYGGTHSDYGSYYHFLETYINYWKDEKLFNKTKQPKNRLEKSKFATKNSVAALDEMFLKFSRIRYWMVSYNSNATPNKDILVSMIKKYKSNVDIHDIVLENNNGGMGLRKNSTEFLFVCY